MSLTKRILGNYNIDTIDDAGDVANNVVITTTSMQIVGDLVVTGASTQVESTDLAITDKTIVLNKGETGAGVTSPTHSGIEIERGTATNVGIRFDDSVDAWQVNSSNVANANAWEYIVTSASPGFAGLQNVVEDLTPELGGNLDTLGKFIVSTAGDIVLDAHSGGAALGRSVVQVLGGLELMIGPPAPSPGPFNASFYADQVSDGGTGLFVINPANPNPGPSGLIPEELVSKSKAMVFGLIF